LGKKERQISCYQTMFRGYPDALTPKQVQEMLGVGERMTYALLRSGEIQSVRLGRLYRIPKTGVIDYLCNAENT